jgi:thiol peroxidase
MGNVTLKGNLVTTSGELPQLGSYAPNFKLVDTTLQEKTLESYQGKRKVISTFPSVDTPTCATSVREFNQKAADKNNTVVLCVSKDLPFALKRFCGDKGITTVETLSAFNSSFAQDYGLEFTDSVLKGLCSRSIIVLDENNRVIYTEQVSETADEPNYQAALDALSVTA